MNNARSNNSSRHSGPTSTHKRVFQRKQKIVFKSNQQKDQKKVSLLKRKIAFIKKSMENHHFEDPNEGLQVLGLLMQLEVQYASLVKSQGKRF
jgi:hypothetical protein